MSAEAYGRSKPERPELRLVTNNQQPETAETDGNLTVMDGFVAYLKQEQGLTLQEITTRDIPVVTAGAHQFLHGVVTSRHKKLLAAGQTPNFHPTPTGAIKDIYSQYFRDYGLSRWTSTKRLADESRFIADNTAEIEAKSGEDSRTFSHPKYDKFPEVALSFELQRLLSLTRNNLAAEAVEVLRASYGYRFRDIGGKAMKAALARQQMVHDYEEELDRVQSSYEADELWS